MSLRAMARQGGLVLPRTRSAATPIRSACAPVRDPERPRPEHARAARSSRRLRGRGPALPLGHGAARARGAGPRHACPRRRPHRGHDVGLRHVRGPSASAIARATWPATFRRRSRSPKPTIPRGPPAAAPSAVAKRSGNGRARAAGVRAGARRAAAAAARTASAPKTPRPRRRSDNPLPRAGGRGRGRAPRPRGRAPPRRAPRASRCRCRSRTGASRARPTRRSS